MKKDNINKTCVVILGMHRSGTSCLTGSLQQYGLYLGEVFEQNPFNRKGNRENQSIILLNNALLMANGGSWKQPPLKLGWQKEHCVERDKIISSISSKSEKIWGFKDPRTLLTFPFWRGGLSRIKPIGIFRHPLLVAKSLHKRNDISIREGLKLWYEYNTKLLFYWEEYSFPIISFDVSREEFLLSVKYIAEYLQINNHPHIEQYFFDDSLRHHLIFKDDIIIHDQILKIYEKLNNIYTNHKKKEGPLIIL